jgi:hypothetical protein
MADFTKEISDELNEIALISLKAKAIKSKTDQAYEEKRVLSDQIAVIDQTAQADIEKIKSAKSAEELVK